MLIKSSIAPNLAADVFVSEVDTRQALAAAWSVCGYHSGRTQATLTTAMSEFRATASAWHRSDEGDAHDDIMRTAITRAWGLSSLLVAAMASTSNDRKVRVLADAYVAAVAYRRALEAANV